MVKRKLDMRKTKQINKTSFKTLWRRILWRNNKFARRYLRWIKKYLRTDLQPSFVRWGTMGFMLTWAIFFLSLFITIKFAPQFEGGNLMEWVFLGIGIFIILIIINLTLYFGSHNYKDPTAKRINKIDESISNVNVNIDKFSNNINKLGDKLDNIDQHIIDLTNEIRLDREARNVRNQSNTANSNRRHH
jgi:hypothetical protein